jgi:small subunit ribosomal protein S9
LIDEERQDAEQDQPEQPAEPEAEETAAGEDAPAPEEAPSQEPTAEDPPAPEEVPAEQAEEPAAEEPAAEEPAAEEAPAEEPAAEDESPEAPSEASEARATASQPGTPAGEAEDVPVDGEAPAAATDEKAKDAVPGAELDPIALEPERELSAEERARREAEEEERARREAELTADADEAPLAAKPAKLSGDARFLATGKRKSSVARVILTPGKGSIQVNQRDLEEYFPRPYLQTIAKQALVQSGYEGNVDVRVRVHGGGVAGQASAVRHGIAKALCDVDPELRPELKRRGMLTRDARVKERRKAGLKKARKRPQFSKR